MPSLSKRNSNRPSPTPHIKHRLAGRKRQQLYKIPSIRGSLQRPKMPSPLIPFKRIISPMPSGLQTHPFAIPIRRKQLRLNSSISHGPTSSHNKKAAPPKRRAATSIYQKKNRSNAKPPHQPRRAEAKRLPLSQNPAKVEMCGSPAAGRQTYKVDREFRTSRRALNVLSVRVRTVRAGDLICLPPGGGAPRPVTLS